MPSIPLQIPPAPRASNVDRAIASMHRALCAVEWDRPGEEPRATVVVDFGAPHRPVARAVMAIEAAAECFIATFEFGVAVERARAEVMRFATRANWELLAGNFELDLEGGAVRFRTSVPFGGAELTEAAIQSVIGAAMSVVDAYAEALDDVIEGRDTADTALERIWGRHSGGMRYDA